MDAQACLVVDLEEDVGLNKLKPEHDQRKSVFFRHLELIRFELGFLGELDEDFLVPPPAFPMRMVRCDELPSSSLGGVVLIVSRAIARRAFSSTWRESLPNFC